MTEFKQHTTKPEKILIVADDLTGAVDTGAQFSKLSFKTCVITGQDEFKKNLDVFDVLVGQFFVLTDVAMYPMIPLPGPFPAKADLTLAHKDTVQGYYQE